MSLDVHAPACSQACSQYSHHAAPHAPRGAYLLKLVSICASVYGMSMNWEGLFSLTYFTNLSNIAMSCVLAVALWRLGRARACGSLDPKDSAGNALWYRIKFVATLSIFVTFFLYTCFLAPTSSYGFLGAFMRNGGASFATHVVGPLCALADFFFFDRAFAPRPVELLYGVVPPLAYVGYVCVLSLGFGVRWKGSMLAPYNFLNFGAETGWFGYNPGHISSTSLGIGVAYFIIVFALIFLAMAAGLFRAMKALRKR